jgi:polysaccharide export outer membrane protein
VTGCSSSPRAVPFDIPGADEKKILVEQYFIGVDDVVNVNVWKNPDLSITVPVRPDGRISVPLVGEILAGGRTPTDVAEEIKRKLSRFIKDPQVTVILEQLNSHEFLSRIRVTGAVQNPLSMSYRQGMTVLDAVLEAGGLNDFASANNTKLFRKINGQVKALRIELDDILHDGDMATNYELQPGDIISIPERVF